MRHVKRLFMLFLMPTLTLTMAGTALAQSYSDDTAAPSATIAAPASGGATVMVRKYPKLGPILTDSEGMTLYLFEKDTKPDVSTCTGPCLANWPAFTAGEPLTLPDGVAGKLTVFARSDGGTMQVAYNGIPLYHYAGDKKPGDTNGQEIGDVWYVVTPGMAFGEDPEDAEATAIASPMASPAASPATSASTTVLVRRDAALGPILTDSEGMTLYLFTNDTKQNESSCTGPCLANWPAFTASGPLTLPAGVEGTLTTFKRSDNGAMQVAYNGIPLYRYAGDKNPGDTNGQEVGDVWYVVAPGARFGAEH